MGSEDQSQKKQKRDTYYDTEELSSLVELTKKDDLTVMVQALPPSTTDFDLFSIFSTKGKVIDVQLITEERTKKCRGVGYVEMADAASAAAVMALNGHLIHGQPMTVHGSLAEKNRLAAAGATASEIKAAGIAVAQSSGTADCSKLYIGGLHEAITDDQLEEIFSPFGAIQRVQIARNSVGSSKTHGFVDFLVSDDAKKAIEAMDGFVLAGKPIRVTVSDRGLAGGGGMGGGEVSSSRVSKFGSIGAPGADMSQPMPGMGGMGGMGGPPPPPGMGGGMNLQPLIGMGGMGGMGMGGMGGMGGVGSLNAMQQHMGGGGGKDNSMGLDSLDADERNDSVGKVTSAQRASLMSKLAAKTDMVLPECVRNAAAGVSGALDNSRCVVMKNMFDRLCPEAEANPNYFNELAEDVRGEASRMGTVLHVTADKWSNGFVYVKMLQHSEAARLREKMDGRFFAKNKIICAHMDEAVYDKKWKTATMVGMIPQMLPQIV